VGLSPLREALSRLVVSGLVWAEGQRGFRVAPASIEDIQDISDVRTNVECLAFRQSIERGDRCTSGAGLLRSGISLDASAANDQHTHWLGIARQRRQADGSRIRQ
jgi:hypothetical protein